MLKNICSNKLLIFLDATVYLCTLFSTRCWLQLMQKRQDSCILKGTVIVNIRRREITWACLAVQLYPNTTRGTLTVPSPFLIFPPIDRVVYCILCILLPRGFLFLDLPPTPSSVSHTGDISVQLTHTSNALPASGCLCFYCAQINPSLPWNWHLSV